MASCSSHFQHQEFWIFNTEYCLFGPDGLEVTPEATHRGRLDELVKCLAVAPPDAVVRWFWADAAVYFEGHEFSQWLRLQGKKAPTEQQLVASIWPNILAAARGASWTRSLQEALAVEQEPDADAAIDSEQDKQPTPGVFVWRFELAPWSQNEGQVALETQTPWWQRAWSARPAREALEYFLNGLLSSRSEVVGLLLDANGIALRFLRATPFSSTTTAADPQACVIVLGGPKGISPDFKAALREGFEVCQIPLLEVSLGQAEQMAHACVAHLRIQDDNKLFRSAVLDLWRLGTAGYEDLVSQVDRALSLLPLSAQHVSHCREPESRDSA